MSGEWSAVSPGRLLVALEAYAPPQDSDSRELAFGIGEYIVFKQYGGSGSCLCAISALWRRIFSPGLSKPLLAPKIGFR